MFSLHQSAHFVWLLLPSLLFVAETGAAEQLRWKLKPDDRLKMVSSQVVATKTTYTGAEVESTIDLRLEGEWIVTGVNDGAIQLTQKVTRVRMEMQSPKTDPVAFDTGDEKRATALARQLQGAIAPLIGASLQVKMSDRGEILSVELPAELSQPKPADEKSAGEPKPLTTAADELKSLLARPLLILPKNEVSAGDTWTVEDATNAPAGALALKKTFKLVELADTDSGQVAKIEAEAKVELDAKTRLKVTESGFNQTVDFNLDDGLVTSSKQELRLRTEQPYRETTIVVDVTTTLTTTLERMQ